MKYWRNKKTTQSRYTIHHKTTYVLDWECDNWYSAIYVVLKITL